MLLRLILLGLLSSVFCVSAQSYNPFETKYFLKEFRYSRVELLHVKGEFTWPQALSLGNDPAIVAQNGPGFMLAPLTSADQYLAAVSIMPEIYPNGKNIQGPWVGILQPPGADAQSDWQSVLGPLVYILFANGEPNDGRPKNGDRKLLGEFIAAVRPLASAYLSSVFASTNGPFSGFATNVQTSTDNLIGFVLTNFVAQADRKSEDVASFWVGDVRNPDSIRLMDQNLDRRHDALLIRISPTAGAAPTTPKVYPRGWELKPGSALSRANSLRWRWTGPTGRGAYSVVRLSNSQTVLKGRNTTTRQLRLNRLRNASYVFKSQNAESLNNPKLSINFVIR